MIAARFASVAMAVLLLATSSFAQQASDQIAPERDSGITNKALVHARTRMVVAANPLAAEAGLQVLRDGGSAADAAVAVQTVLGLVEPQSSGLGGGAFLIWYDAATGALTTFDGRETAPASATPDLFRDKDGKSVDFFDAVVGGRSVGTPGVPRLLETVHRKYGKRPWADLFSPAIKLAEEGFRVSQRLNSLITADAGRLHNEASVPFFTYDGAPLPVGAVLRNPDYAATLKAIAVGGADAFYKGSVAKQIVDAVNSHPTNPGGLALSDLASYSVIERPAVCAIYRGFDVCGMGPPSSGGIAVGQILGMIEPYDIAALGAEDPESWRIIGDASRLAFADRERYVADADFVAVPRGLLNGDYLKARSLLIRRSTALESNAVKAGDPPWDKAELRVDGRSLEQPSTSHFSIVDDSGNVLAMTTSIENAFGSRLFVAGFLLNNQLTDFSFEPEKNGQAVANRVEAGKRPRSSMAPTIVLKEGKPVYALGSAGGSQIIVHVAKTLIALIDWKMDIQTAVSLPHLSNRFGTYDLEAGTTAEQFSDDLEALGFKTKIRKLNSGLQGVAIDPDGLTGGADPRREGVAVGD